MTENERSNMIWNRFNDETRWCIRRCIEGGVDPIAFSSVQMLALNSPIGSYTLVKDSSDKDKFDSMAKGLRELWPAGSKDVNGHAYAWRDSVANLSTRLKKLWSLRKLDSFSEEEVLSCARQYLAQFEDNAKFMQTLPYFILKKDTRSIGKTLYKSRLADMLEGRVEQDNENDWASILDGSYSEGELI